MTTALLNTQGVEQRPLRDFTEYAYLNYAMYVILDRALPHIADGLKPVQRRIIYAMSELGLRNTAKPKKSARTVGDVIGKFHPHGDTSCYEAMVLMAQSFSYRYPLVDGQGNWGSADDPKSFAAMRYTESRLTPIAELLLTELTQGTIDWVPNFDGTLEEPQLLPARLPHILLNGGSGIAVGMATDIPPHNLREVTAACIHLLDHPRATLEDILVHLPAPDFPTAAEIITPQSDLKQLYRTGNGSIRQRAIYHKEQHNIVITALPHQVSGAKIIEQIANEMRDKRLPMVEDLRDESDHKQPTRLVIVMRSGRVDVDACMAHLFAATDLEHSYRVNLNMIGIDGRPQVKPLLMILQEWLAHRLATVTKRIQHRLTKVEQRLTILSGLLIAYLNIDAVILIIRTEDHPKKQLMQQFNLSEIQAEAILELKLRHLAKLEEIAIRTEQADLAVEQQQLTQLLASDQALKKLVRQELKADGIKYGDARRSPLVVRAPAQALREEALVIAEPVTVILSQMGWIRAAKGHEIDAKNLHYKAGDSFKMAAIGKTTQTTIVFDNCGRTYALPTHHLPSARGQGEPLTGKISPPNDASFVGICLGEATQSLVLATSAGYGFVTTLSELITKNKTGKAVLNVSASAQALTPAIVNSVAQDWLAAVTNTGHLLLFSIKDLPIMTKGKGNKMLSLPKAKSKEYVVAIASLTNKQSLVVYSGQRQLTLKPQEWRHYCGERAQRGRQLPRGLQRVERLAVV